jgi:hypothetical protein
MWTLAAREMEVGPRAWWRRTSGAGISRRRMARRGSRRRGTASRGGGAAAREGGREKGERSREEWKEPQDAKYPALTHARSRLLVAEADRRDVRYGPRVFTNLFGFP